MREMSVITRTVSDLVFGVIVVFGAYIIIHGHLTPGGGFQGGAVVASGFAMVLIVYGRVRASRLIPRRTLHILEPLGAIAFAVLAMLGVGYTIFNNLLANTGGLFGDRAGVPLPHSNAGYINTGGTIPLMNMAVGLKVLAGLAVLVLAMATSIRGRRDR